MPSAAAVKLCPRCKERPRVRGGAYCKPCKSAYQVEWARNFKEKHPDRAESQRWKHYLKRVYGMTPEAYDAMLENQKGVCAICGSALSRDGARGLHVDHDHATGQVRGLLCSMCNKGLGCFGDDHGRLQYAIDYLAYWHEHLKGE